MHFDLLQSLSLAGDPATPNDDRTGNSAHLAWVIDGATDLGPPGLIGTQGGAAWLAGQANAAFAAAPDAPVAETFATIGTQLIAAYHAARTRDPHGPWELPIASALAVRLAGAALEIGWLGDCAALLRRGTTVTRIGPLPDREKEAARAASLAQHGLGQVKRNAPILENLRSTRGRPDMRVLSVDPVHMANLETATLPCVPGDELLLMTDGFAALVDSYAAIDEAALFASVRTRGLAAIATDLRALETEDAACTRFPRFKISDDATALWLRVGD